MTVNGNGWKKAALALLSLIVLGLMAFGALNNQVSQLESEIRRVSQVKADAAVVNVQYDQLSEQIRSLRSEMRDDLSAIRDVLESRR